MTDDNIKSQLLMAMESLHEITGEKISFSEQQRLESCLLEGYSVNKAVRWTHMLFKMHKEAMEHCKSFQNGYESQCAYNDYYMDNEWRLLEILDE